jgi:lipid-binding SYLF domain-containing protein
LTVAKAIEVLNEVTANPGTGMPGPILQQAEGIAIIPDQFKAGFVIGARFGRGLILLRQPDGSWSNPVFVQSFGGSFGLQAGAQATDLVLVFKGRRSVESFLWGKGKLTLGVDASAAAGPVGRQIEAGTDLAFRAEILSYSRSRGIFAGVSAAGGSLSIDDRANMIYYGRPVGPAEVFAQNSDLRLPQSGLRLKKALAERAGLPAVVVEQVPHQTQAQPHPGTSPSPAPRRRRTEPIPDEVVPDDAPLIIEGPREVIESEPDDEAAPQDPEAKRERKTTDPQVRQSSLGRDGETLFVTSGESRTEPIQPRRSASSWRRVVTKRPAAKQTSPAPAADPRTTTNPPATPLKTAEPATD